MKTFIRSLLVATAAFFLASVVPSPIQNQMVTSASAAPCRSDVGGACGADARFERGYPRWRVRENSRVRYHHPRRVARPTRAPASDCCRTPVRPVPVVVKPAVDRWGLVCACLQKLGLNQGSDFYSKAVNGESHAVLTASGHAKVVAARALAQAQSCVR